MHREDLRNKILKLLKAEKWRSPVLDCRDGYVTTSNSRIFFAVAAY